MVHLVWVDNWATLVDCFLGLCGEMLCLRIVSWDTWINFLQNYILNYVQGHCVLYHLNLYTLHLLLFLAYRLPPDNSLLTTGALIGLQCTWPCGPYYSMKFFLVLSSIVLSLLSFFSLLIVLLLLNILILVALFVWTCPNAVSHASSSFTSWPEKSFFLSGF